VQHKERARTLLPICDSPVNDEELAELPTNGLVGPSTPNTNFPTPARPPQLARTTKGPTAQCRRHRHFTIIPNSKVRRGGGGRISWINRHDHIQKRNFSSCHLAMAISENSRCYTRCGFKDRELKKRLSRDPDRPQALCMPPPHAS
jgi:hypothetical protein